MFKTQQKIKNPLLKQLGNKNTSRPNTSNNTSNNVSNYVSNNTSNNVSNTSNTNKLDLETLIEYIKNISSNKEEIINNITPLCDSNNDIIQEDPKNGEYVDFISNKTHIKEIIDGIHFKRCGVLKIAQGKLKFYNNLSLLSSLMTCLSDKFNVLDEQTQLNYVKSLKLYIYNTFTKTFYDFQNYKELSKDFNFDRSDISKNLYNYDIQRNEFLVISDIFHINIFIFDIARDKLFFTGVLFIPHKKNIFLIKKEDGFFEPLYLDNSFYVDDQYEFIQYLIENNHKVDLFFKSEKYSIFEINYENLDKYTITKELKLDINNKILERRLYNLNKTSGNEIKEVDKEVVDKADKADKEIGVKADKDDDIKEVDIKDDDIKEVDIKEVDNKVDEKNKDINDYTENKNIIGYNVATEIGSLSDSGEEEEKNIEVDNIDDSELVKTIKYNKIELKKMKLNELVIISKSLNITVEYEQNNKIKKKTKDTLIEEILQK